MYNNNEIVKEILCDVLEIEISELIDDASFEDDYDADSLRAVEILAALEKRFDIKIPQDELPNMSTFLQVKQVLLKYGWVE